MSGVYCVASTQCKEMFNCCKSFVEEDMALKMLLHNLYKLLEEEAEDSLVCSSHLYVISSFNYLSVNSSLLIDLYLYMPSSYFNPYLSIHLSIFISTYLSIYLSIHPSIYLYIYLSIFLYFSTVSVSYRFSLQSQHFKESYSFYTSSFHCTLLYLVA